MKIAFVEDNFLKWEDDSTFSTSPIPPDFMLTTWESIMDIYAGAMSRLGHDCVKYVPSLKEGNIERYTHKLGHTAVKIPSSRPISPLVKRQWPLHQAL